jgi:hypothetical protein
MAEPLHKIFHCTVHVPAYIVYVGDILAEDATEAARLARISVALNSTDFEDAGINEYPYDPECGPEDCEVIDEPGQ